MINFLMFGGIFLLFLGLPISIVVTIVFAVKKRKKRTPMNIALACAVLGVAFICVGGYLYGQTDEYKQFLAEKEQEELERADSEKDNSEIVESSNSKSEDSEQNENHKEPSKPTEGGGKNRTVLQMRKQNRVSLQRKNTNPYATKCITMIFFSENTI